MSVSEQRGAGKTWRRKDISGEQVGMLYVVRLIERSYKNGVRYLCRCVCGKEIEQRASTLSQAKRNEKAINCGCVQGAPGRQCARVPKRGKYSQLRLPLHGLVGQRHGIHKAEPGWMTSMRHCYINYRAQAAKRGYSFSLALEDFHKVTQGDCYYCGVSPNQFHRLRYHAPYIYNGVDRVDNSRGYELDNIVACCGVCNRAKRDRGATEFIEWAKRVAHFWRDK